MRRPVTVAMSAVSLVVATLSVRSSLHPPDTGHGPGTAAPAGVVRPSPSHRPSPSPLPARARVRPKASATPSRPARRLTVDGSVTDTLYGPVQVRLVLRAGRIVAAHAIVRPGGDGQTDAINSQAIPVLDREVLTAQGAGIDTVSGATFTSAGYRTSLQSALDAAHRAGAR